MWTVVGPFPDFSKSSSPRRVTEYELSGRDAARGPAERLNCPCNKLNSRLPCAARTRPFCSDHTARWGYIDVRPWSGEVILTDSINIVLIRSRLQGGDHFDETPNFLPGFSFGEPAAGTCALHGVRGAAVAAHTGQRRDYGNPAVVRHGRKGRNARGLGLPPGPGPRFRRVETHRRAFVLGTAGFRDLLLRYAGPRQTRRRPGYSEGNRHLSPLIRDSRRVARPRDSHRLRSRDDRHHGAHQRAAGRRHAPGRVLSLQLRHHAAGQDRPQRHRSARGRRNPPTSR